MASPSVLPPRVGARTTCSLPIQLQPPASESSASSSDDDADIEPPEVVDAPTAKLLDALGLMLRSRYCDERRHHPNLQLPLELLAGSDVQWILKVGKDGSSATVAKHTAHGKKNIPDFVANHMQYSHHGTVHDEEPHQVFIDSPRSLMVLLANGYSAAALKPVPGDEITSQRRHRALGLLTPLYHEQCRKVSSQFVADVLRGAANVWEHVMSGTSGANTPSAMSPRGGGDQSPASGDEHQSPPNRKSPKPLLARAVSQASLPAIAQRRTKPQDLARLQRLRTNFTVEWGMRQQTLAEETFHVARVKAIVEKRRPVVASPTERAATAMSATRSSRSASSPTSSPSPRRGHTPTAMTSPSATATSDTAAPTPGTTPAKRKAIPNHVAFVKAESKRIEEERRQQVERAIAEKAKAADEAVQRRQRERAERMKAQRARGREVHDVAERMTRVEAVKRMMVVKHMEEDTETKLAWQQQQRAMLDNLRYQNKIRTTLQHRTRQLVEEAAIAVSKATSLQEMAVTAPVEVQRTLKAESRQILVKYLRREDELVNQWSRFEDQ